MSKLSVIAKVVAKKESVELVKRELLNIIEPTRNEDGCIGYFLHQDNENPALFMLYENWKSEEKLDDHMNTVHFKALVAAISGITEELTINKLTQLESE